MNDPASSQAAGRTAGAAMFGAFSISTRILAGFAIVILMMVGMAVFSVTRVNSINTSLSTINDVNSVKQRHAINFRGSVHDRAISLRDVVLVQRQADLDRVLADIDDLTRKYAESAGPLDAIMASDVGGAGEDQQILASIKEIEARTLPLITRIVDLRLAGDTAEAQRLLLAEASPAFTEWLRRINQFIDLQEAHNQLLGDQVQDVASNFDLLVGSLCALAFVIAAAVAYASLHSLKPLTTLTGLMGRVVRDDLSDAIPFTDRRNEVGEIARAVQLFKETASKRILLEAEVAERNRLAAEEAARAQSEQEHASAAFGQALGRLVEGDLTARVDAEVSEAYAAIKRDLNAGLEKVRAAFASVGAGIGSIRGMSTELATAAEDLSRRTESQAANLEETAAAVEEITATVKAAADSSAHARQVVSSTKQDAEQSGEVVSRAVEAMNAIEASSRKISQIIGVIDEIAFQTNLLALNAGVEAARAGEAGRGFAVVATEVRALAQRSAEAAKQIKDLISASTTQVDQGVDLVGETGHALRRIVTAVAEINELVAGIAAGAAEQSTGLAQVNVAIVQMDKITQQNAAMVEETTAAVRTLASQTEEVALKVDRFRTGGAGSDSAAEWAQDAMLDEASAAKASARWPRAEAPRKLRVAAGAARPAARDEGWQEF